MITLGGVPACDALAGINAGKKRSNADSDNVADNFRKSRRVRELGIQLIQKNPSQ
jgi:hypothetical protein